MKLHLCYKLIPALALLIVISGCATPVLDVNLKNAAKSVKVGPRQMTGDSITIAVVAPDSAVIKFNNEAVPPVCTFIPAYGSSPQHLAGQVASEKDTTAVIVFRNYGKMVGELVKANFATRFAHVEVTVAPTPGKADCIIQPHETLEYRCDGMGMGLIGLKSTVSLTGTYAGKPHTVESTCMEDSSHAHLIWQLPVAVVGMPLGTCVVGWVNSSWDDGNLRTSIKTAWNESAAKLAGELAP